MNGLVLTVSNNICQPKVIRVLVERYISSGLIKGAKLRPTRWRNYSSEPLEYLKFNPLPPKTTTLASLYTGPQRWPATDTFYTQLAGRSKAKSDGFRQFRPNPNFSKGNVSPQTVNCGDIVEIIARNGNIVNFGMVTSTQDNKSFDYVAVDGSFARDHVSRVSFALQGFLNGMHSKMPSSDEIKTLLSRMIRTANQQVPKLVPIITAVHSTYAVEDWPRAVDFNEICRCVDKMSPKNKVNRSTETEFSKVDRLAVYFALAYHNLYFVRMSGSTFVAASLTSAHAISKVMRALTRTELEHGAEQLMYRRATSDTPHKAAGVAETLLKFLNHWSLWNDTRLERAVAAVLEECIGRHRKLDSPRALSSVLSQVHGVCLFPWLQSSSSTLKFNNPPYYMSNPESTSNANLYTAKESSKTEDAHVDSSHWFSTNSVHSAIYLNPSLAIAFDFENYILNIFVPRISGIPSILGKFSPYSIIPRSTKLNGHFIPFLSASKSQKFAFTIGKESSSYQMQIKINQNTSEWELSSARVSVAELIPFKMSEFPRLAELLRILSTIEPLISDHELEIPETSEFYDEDDESNDIYVGYSQSLKMLALHVRAAAGRIAGIYMKNRDIEAPFLVTSDGKEKVCSTPGYHEKLNQNSYVPIASPFDSGLSLLAQKKLQAEGKLPLMLFQGKRRPALDVKLQETFMPQVELLSLLEQRDLRYWTLKSLQSQLRTSGTFQIFRCILTESSAEPPYPEGQLVKAFCPDLSLHCEVYVPSKTEPVFCRDQVICTEILELDPLAGLLVVSM